MPSLPRSGHSAHLAGCNSFAETVSTFLLAAGAPPIYHRQELPNQTLMDIDFKCPKCDQDLSADANDAGTEIECPACHETIVIPQPSPAELASAQASTESAAAKEEKHF